MCKRASCFDFDDDDDDGINITVNKRFFVPQPQWDMKRIDFGHSY